MIVLSIVFFELGLALHTTWLWGFGLFQLIIGLLLYLTKDNSGDWGGGGPQDEHRLWRAT